MKKLLIIALILLLGKTSYCQQLDHWYIAPNDVDMTSTTTIPAPIAPIIGSNSAGTALRAGNGFYDNTGNVLFYIADGNIYDYNNTIMRPIKGGGTEIIVLPFGTNSTCQSKYSVFVTSGATEASSLWQYIVDMNSLAVTEVYVDQITYNGNVSTEFGAIALSKPNAANDRYLYYLAGPGTIGSPNGGQINKIIVHNDGTFTPVGKIYPTPLNPNPNAGAEIIAQELDLSPDGRWLAWGSFAAAPAQCKYHIIELNTSGDYVNNSYVQFNNPGITGNNVIGFRGLEFYKTGSTMKLFIGEGTSGIHSINLPVSINPPAAAFKLVANSFSYGNSQIELANNGRMYVSSSQTSNTVAAFEPFNSNPIIITGFTIPNPPKATFQLKDFFTLPDQIDDQNYTTLLQPPIIPVPTVNSYTYTGGMPNWQYGPTNPWGATTPVYILKELIIENNSTLTIENMEFRFSPEAKVIIKPGSHLILKNSTFTSTFRDECPAPYTWRGVEVWGNSSIAHTSTSNHGKLTLNNSMIEFAQWGARNYNPISPTTSTGGKIYISNNSSFKDNLIGIELKPFQISNYLSSFSGTTFTVTDQYPFVTAPKHVIIDKCRNINFNSCHFNISSSLTNINSFQSIGIKSIDAGFYVTNNSSFTKLWHGVDAVRVSLSYSFTLNKAIFTDNIIGVIANGINSINIKFSEFNIGGNAYGGSSAQVGLLMGTCSGYVIEENKFKLSTALSTTQGIVTSGSGPADNQIYRNTFTDLHYGNIASGINRDNTLANVHGLQYLCNTNQSNDIVDIFIGKQVGSIPYGIRGLQGTSLMPAGNSFSHISPSPPSDIYNKASFFNYYYLNGSIPQTPWYFNTPPVAITPTNIVNNCPTSACNPCPVASLPPDQVQILSAQYDIAETSYLNLLYVYNELMDGGNTNALLTEIQLTWSPEANALRLELLALSPYLSTEILREVAERNELPQAMLFEICMANPDATKDEGFLRYLLEECPQPMPQYMIDMIIASWEDKTARTTMENSLANYSHEMSTISNTLVADIHYSWEQENNPDLIINYRDQLVYWLNRTQSLTAKYDLIELYLSESQLELSAELLNSIPDNFRFSEDQQTAYEEYRYFYYFRRDVMDSGRELDQLDESQVEELINFTAELNSFAKVLAANLLCSYYNQCREINYDIDPNERVQSFGNSPAVRSTVPSGIKFSASPNPASEFVIFKYSVPMNKNINLIISDVNGRKINSFKLRNTEGEIKWLTGNLNGLYNYSLSDGKTSLANGKITINN